MSRGDAKVSLWLRFLRYLFDFAFIHFILKSADTGMAARMLARGRVQSRHPFSLWSRSSIKQNTSKQEKEQTMADKVADAMQTMVRNLEEKTGKKLVEWTAIAKKSGFAKHGEIVKFLKTEHGLAWLRQHGRPRDGYS